MERDIAFERRHNEILSAELRRSESNVATLTERIRLLEVDLQRVEPYSVGDRIKILNFTDPREHFGTVTSSGNGRVHFNFDGSGRRTWRLLKYVRRVGGD